MRQFKKNNIQLKYLQCFSHLEVHCVALVALVYLHCYGRQPDELEYYHTTWTKQIKCMMTLSCIKTLCMFNNNIVYYYLS